MPKERRQRQEQEQEDEEEFYLSLVSAHFSFVIFHFGPAVGTGNGPTRSRASSL
jgi:hypothetical protein